MREARLSLAAAATMYVLVSFVASTHPGPSTWGLDAAGYLPAILRSILFGIMASMAGILWVAAASAPAEIPAPARSSKRSDSLRRYRWVGLVLLAVALWVFRTRSYFLGDQIVWLDYFKAGQRPLFSEPLAAAIWHGFVAVLRALGMPTTEPLLAVLPVLCGAVAAILAWKLAGEIGADPDSRAAPFALLLTIGTIALYCGYIESYPISSVAILLFLWLAVRQLRTRASPVPPALALSVAASSHLAALYLYPAYAYLLLRDRGRAAGRVGLAFLPAVACAALLLALGYRPADLLTPFRVLGVAVVSAGGGQPTLAFGRTPTGQRLFDLANLCLLVLPVPAMIVVARVLQLRRTPPCWKPSQVFLAIASLCGLLTAFILVVPGSPAQDWDLMSLAVLPLAVLGVSLLPALGAGVGRPSVTWGLGLLSLVAALTFVLVNANAQAGLRRFKVLVSPAAHLSTHERGYGNEKLVKFYMAQGRHDSVLVYATRAVEAESTNTRYWGNVGTALYNLKRYGEAAFYFGEAARRGSERPEVHYYLGQCLMHEHRYREALVPLRRAIDLGGEQRQYLFSLGLARVESGDEEGARRVWSYILGRWPGDQRTAQAYREYFGAVPESP